MYEVLHRVIAALIVSGFLGHEVDGYSAAGPVAVVSARTMPGKRVVKVHVPPHAIINPGREKEFYCCLRNDDDESFVSLVPNPSIFRLELF